jgi:glycine hydroxymethyltransferase
MERCEPAALLDKVDEWIAGTEKWVDRQGISLNAGHNIHSRAVRRAMATSLDTRPSLGDPGNKHGTGVELSDRVEVVAIEGLKRLFGAAHAEHRIPSGTMANLCVYLALLQRGDPIFALPGSAAAHVSHHAGGAAGLCGLQVHPVPCEPGTHLVAWEAFAAEVERVRPKLIALGTSLPLLPYDMGRVRQIADSVAAYVMYDAAHVAGMIAGGRFQEPLREGADIVTMSTYKSFAGPAGGAIVTNSDELHDRLRRVTHPGLTSNYDGSRVAGLAVACLELMQFGAAYADQCLRNAQSLGRALSEHGLEPWAPDGDGTWTRSHMLAVDATPWSDGDAASRRAERSNIFFTGIGIPRAEADGSALRLGVQELTRWGMREPEMAEIARLVDESLQLPGPATKTRREVIEFRAAFQAVQFCF